MVINSKFWQGKKVLVTGHTGFKGAWLCMWLQALGAELFGFALPSDTRPNLYEMVNVGEGMQSILADIRDIDAIRKTVTTFNPEIIVHMAAQSLVRYAYHNPVATYHTNVIGTVNLLEVIREIDSVKVLVNVTTDKCYEDKVSELGYNENDPLGGKEPYSSSKACSELVTEAYRQSYFTGDGSLLSIASARAGNVIGGGDWALDRLIPDIIRASRTGELLHIRNPHAIRPWQHVLDCLSGYLTLVERLWYDTNFATAWNFGPNKLDCKPVAWVVQQVIEKIHCKIDCKKNNEQQPYEADYLRLDITKAKDILHWQPKWNVESALEATILWYLAWQNKEDMRAFTLQQIIEYQAI